MLKYSSQPWPLKNTEDAGEGHSGGKWVSAVVWELTVSVWQMHEEHTAETGSAEGLGKPYKGEITGKLAALPHHTRKCTGTKV